MCRYCHGIEPGEKLYFFEVERGDASEFEGTLKVTGENVDGYAVLRTRSSVIANAIAAMRLGRVDAETTASL